MRIVEAVAAAQKHAALRAACINAQVESAIAAVGVKGGKARVPTLAKVIEQTRNQRQIASKRAEYDAKFARLCA